MDISECERRRPMVLPGDCVVSIAWNLRNSRRCVQICQESQRLLDQHRPSHDFLPCLITNVGINVELKEYHHS